ncbi:MAG: zf-HC2 domain-containing protein [Myxococcales bacterium]|nr:zf-HC2 domain-containing protein [Myxococcales bacterium]
MDCPELDHFLYPYLDGEFDAGERVELERHLAACAECAKRVHSERLFREAFKERAGELAVSPPAPAHLRAAVQHGLRLEHRRANLARWSKMGFATAASIAVAASAVYFVQRPAERQRYVDAAVAGYARKLPMEIQKPSAAELQDWFRGKVAHRVSVPSLRNAVPAGGRLLNVRDKSAAVIEYDVVTPEGKKPGSVVVFVVEDPSHDAPFEPLPNADVARSRGYNTVTWRDEDILYTLVSDLEDADIRTMIEPSAPSRASHLMHGPQGPPALQIQPASLQR